MTTTPTGSPATPVKSQEQTNLDTAFKILDGIQDQIRFADAKAGFIVALIAVLFGFTAGNVADVKAIINYGGACWQKLLICGPLVLYAACSLAAVVTSVRVVRSRFGGKAPQSKVFFLHIIGSYGWDYARYAADMKATATEDWIQQVGTQVLEVSHIASAKHTRFRLSCDFAIAAVILWFVVFCEILWITNK